MFTTTLQANYDFYNHFIIKQTQREVEGLRPGIQTMYRIKFGLAGP